MTLNILSCSRNGHSEWGKGIVDAVFWGYAYVTFKPDYEYEDHIVDVTELSLVR